MRYLKRRWRYKPTSKLASFPNHFLPNSFRFPVLYTVYSRFSSLVLRPLLKTKGRHIGILLPVSIRHWHFCQISSRLNYRWQRYNVTSFLSALHGMPARSSNEKGVRLSVCQTRALWQNGRKICPDLWAPAGFFPGVGKLRVWGWKSPSGVQGTILVGAGGKAPEADDMLWK